MKAINFEELLEKFNQGEEIEIQECSTEEKINKKVIDQLIQDEHYEMAIYKEYVDKDDWLVDEHDVFVLLVKSNNKIMMFHHGDLMTTSKISVFDDEFKYMADYLFKKITSDLDSYLVKIK